MLAGRPTFSPALVAGVLAALAAVAGLTGPWACASPGAFSCVLDEQCGPVGSGAVCAPSGYCAFYDPDCPSGYRHAERAAAGLAGECVAPAGVDGGPDGALADAGPVDGAVVHDAGGTPDGPSQLGPFGAAVPVSELSSPHEEDDPTLTGDMLEIYFESTRSGDKEIWRAARADPSFPFGTPELCAELSAAGDRETTPEITANGLRIFFASDRGADNLDVWVSARSSRADPWPDPWRDDGLSDAVLDDYAPALTSSRLVGVLAVTSAAGNTDLFEVRRLTANDPWDSRRALTELNSLGSESSPWLSADGLTLLFNAPRGGDEDLLVAERASVDAAFGPPVEVEGVNTSEDEQDPWLSPDGRTIYFARWTTAGDRFEVHVATR